MYHIVFRLLYLLSLLPLKVLYLLSDFAYFILYRIAGYRKKIVFQNLSIAFPHKTEHDQNVYIHCGTGYRSVIAASLLKKEGIHNIRNVVGGWDELKQQKNIPTEKDSSVLN